MGEGRENCKREEDTGPMDLRKFNRLDSRTICQLQGLRTNRFSQWEFEGQGDMRLRLIGCRGEKGEATGRGSGQAR